MDMVTLLQSRWIASVVLVAAFALWTEHVVAQPFLSASEFIPAPDEPCGATCPNPDPPLSRLNHPPRDDNFRQMFVPTETGVALCAVPQSVDHPKRLVLTKVVVSILAPTRGNHR